MGIYEKILSNNHSYMENVWKRIDEKMRFVALRNKDKLPGIAQDGVYNDLSQSVPYAWTNGFWPGIMWLMYVGTQKEIYKDVAISAEELLERAAENFDVLHHDVGFMWHISSGVHYRLLGDKEAKSRAMYMAASLASRYNLNTKVIRAFPEEARERMVIIDSMMNICLLYWASRETKDPRFRLIAQSHADTTMENHIRPDGSVKHILEYDLYTGECLGTVIGQGCGVDSSWTRGQAWAIYGYTLSYIHTGKQEYLDTAKRVAHYFIANASNTDYVIPYDFRQPMDSTAGDTSAAAITACGLIELAKVVPECEKALYLQPAIKMIKVLVEQYCNWNSEEDGILQGGAVSANRLDIPVVFGEYFFVEAIYKLNGFEPLFW